MKIKKTISFVLTAAILLCSLAVCASAATFGDVTGDGVVKAADARTVLRYAAKLESLTEEQLLCCDVNSDGKVNAADAREILRYSAKLVNDLNYYSEYYFKVAMNVNGQTTYAESATDGSSIYIKTTDLGTIDWGLIFSENGDIYFIDYENNKYCNFSAEEQAALSGMMGEDFDFAEMFKEADFSIPIPKYTSFMGVGTSEEVVDGKTYKTVAYKSSDSISVFYYDSETLAPAMRRSYTPSGAKLIESMTFEAFSAKPSQYLKPPAGFEKVDTIEFLLSMQEAFPDFGF